jgi:hypothetical protein
VGKARLVRNAMMAIHHHSVSNGRSRGSATSRDDSGLS